MALPQLNQKLSYDNSKLFLSHNKIQSYEPVRELSYLITTHTNER